MADKPDIKEIALMLLDGYRRMVEAAEKLDEVGRRDLAATVRVHAGKCLVFQVRREDVERLWPKAKDIPDA
jgi:hypothetical protein